MTAAAPTPQPVVDAKLPFSAEAVLASKGRSFYWARFFLGRLHAARATRLYRFCRYVDDLVDECTSPEQAHASLNHLVDCLEAGQSDHDVVSDGIRLLNECRIEPYVFLDLIAGVRSDINLVAYQDLDSLIRYSYQVAGTVGLMMCAVCDTHDQAAHAHAVDLGIAMQLTNMCRDVETDARLGRRYLPANLVSAASATNLVMPTDQLKQRACDAVCTLLQLANSYYRSGEQGLAYLPLRARIGLWIAARVYGDIGSVLSAHDYNPWMGRATVSVGRKILITTYLCFTLPFTVSFWRKPSTHNQHLHQAIAQFFPRAIP